MATFLGSATTNGLYFALRLTCRMFAPGGCVSHLWVCGSRSEMRLSSATVSGSRLAASPGASLPHQ